MTKEQIEIHGEVIKWFCDNPEKGVWWKTSTEQWALSKAPLFEVDKPHIQNDEFASYRKAIVDGKTIQWKTITDTDAMYTDRTGGATSKFSNVCKYRIKPDELEFKVGNWVRCRHGIDKIASFHKDETIYLNRFRCYQFISDIKLWEPQEGDVVICWGTGSMRTLIKLDKDSLGNALDEDIKAGRCIPYIGQSFKEMN